MLRDLLRDDEDEAATVLVGLLHGGVGAGEGEALASFEEDVNDALAPVDGIVVDVEAVHIWLLRLPLARGRRLAHASGRGRGRWARHAHSRTCTRVGLRGSARGLDRRGHGRRVRRARPGARDRCAGDEQ